LDINKRLQTSPYIIITLDMNTNLKQIFSILTGKYHKINSTNLEILEHCKYPREINDLWRKFGHKAIEGLVNDMLLSDPSRVWEQTNVEYMEIEICTHCNWRCQYCPVYFDPKPPKTMDLDLYNEIIDKAARHSTIKHIAFNCYNEPTLDIHFEDRIRKLAQTDMKLVLFTNGSELDEEKIKLLKETDVLHKVRFNLPSVNETEFNRFTGSRLFKKTLSNIENAISAGLDTEIIVNGTTEEVANNLGKIENRFKSFDNVKVVQYSTTDRAGLLKNKYAMNYNHTGNLYGCMQILNKVCVGVMGNFFICTMDYYQKDVYGNIKDGEISDILKSQKAQLIRKQVFGAESPPKDYICRKCWATMLARIDGRHSKAIRPIFE